MKKIILCFFLILGAFLPAFAQTRPNLGSATDFTLLAASGIYNKDASRISGNIGVWPANTVEGLTPSMVIGTQHLGNATAQKAQTDARNGYNSIDALTSTPDKNLTGKGITTPLGPGVYTFDNTTTLSGTISLDAANNPNAIFIFKVKGGLIISPNTVFKLLNDARRLNVYWQVADTLNVGTKSNLVGNFLVKNSIRLGKEAAINGGRLFSLDNKVVLNRNNPVTPSIDLGITKTKSLGQSGTNPYSVGELVTFTLVARNNGPIDDYNVKIVDQLDVALEYVEASAQSSIAGKPVNNFSYDASSRVFQWTTNEFKNGETVTILIKVRIKSPGGIGNTATILGTVTDDNFDNNSASIVPAICAKITRPGEIKGPKSICTSGDPAVFSIDPIPGVQNYTWLLPTGWRIVPPAGGGIPTNTITVQIPESTPGNPVASSGTISVMVNNGCGDSEPSFYEVTTTAKPAATPGAITSVDQSGYNPCIRNSETFFTYQIAGVPNADEYIWTIHTPDNINDNGGWEIVSGQNTTQIKVKAGTKEVIIDVVSKNACGVSSARSLRITPSFADPVKPTPINGPAVICLGVASTFSTSSNDPSNRFNWTVPAGWSLSGQGTNQIQVTAPATAANTTGSIKVKTVNNCGVSEEISISVNVRDKVISGPITGPNTPCANTNATYTVEAPGATSFIWKTTGQLEIVGNNTGPSVSVLVKPGGGTLSVSALNECGASKEQSLAITPQNKPALPTAINTTSNALCTGTTGVVFSIAGVTGATGYTWQILDAAGQPAADWPITAISPDQKRIEVTVGKGPVTITVSATNNCGTSELQTLAVTPSNGVPPTPGLITGSTTLCAGSANLIYSVTEVPGAISYIWTVPTGNGWQMVSGQGTASIVVKAGTTEGFITVKTKNNCGESTAASQKQVIPATGKPPVPGAITASKPAVCANEQNITFSIAPVQGASAYIWTVPDGWQITTGQTTTSITVTAGAIGGDIYVTAFNACGQSANSSSLVVPISSELVKPVIIGEAVPCTGSSANKYRVANVPGVTEYIWEVPNGWSITSGAGTSEITVSATETAGTISVKAKNNCSESPVATLAVNPSNSQPIAAGGISGNNGVCRNQSELIYSIAPVANASTYFWTVPTGWEITEGQGTTTIKVSAKTNSGTISVLPKNGCGAAATATTLAVTVSSQTTVTPGTISGTNQICPGENNLLYSIAAVNGATGYFWQVPTEDGWQIVSGQGTTTIKVLAGNKAGTISVMANNNCGTGPAAKLTVNLLSGIADSPRITGNKNQCAGSSNQIYQVTAIVGAVNYTWKVPSDWKIESGQGTSSIRVTVGKTAGNIEVIVATKCGPGIAGTLAVALPGGTLPTPAAIGGDSQSLICSGQQGITYTISPVPGALSYKWDITPASGWTITSGQGTTSIRVTAGTQAAAISVQAINSCGISNASTLVVTPGSSSAVTIGAITGPAITCAAQTDLIYTIDAVSGATGYIWTVPSGWRIVAGENTNRITVTAGSVPGTISVAAANTCSKSIPSVLAVSVNAAPVAPRQIKDLSTPCAGLIYAIESVPGAQEYTWSVPEGWSITAGQGTARIQVNAPEGSKEGTISVVAHTATCASAGTTLVANPSLGKSDLQIANVFSPNGDGVNDTWTITNIKNYPDNEFVIINRWGAEVFKARSYENNWNGGELTDGTYYYVLKVKLCDGSYKTEKGYVMIMR